MSKTVPQIRFKRFKDEWKIKPFSSFAEMHARIGWQNLRKNEFLNEGNYYLITGTDFTDGFVNLKTCHYVSKERYEQDVNIQPTEKSILITKDGTLGKIARIKYLDKPATLNAGVFNVQINKTTDQLFVYEYLKGPFLMDYVSEKATGGTIKHLNQNILVDFPVPLPEDRLEQEHIGKLLTNFEMIILEEKELVQKFINFKKTLLIKLLLEKENDSPVMRFAKFNDSWKQGNLGSIATIIGGNAWKSSEYTQDGNCLVVTIANVSGDLKINDSIGNHINCSGTGNFELKADDILVSLTGNVGRVSKMTNVRGVLNQRVGKIIPEENSVSAKYLFHALRNSKFELAMIDSGQGAAQKNISNGDILSYSLSWPINKQEQEAIADCLDRVDELIILHQNKLDLLCKFKASLAKKVFPN